MAFNLIHCDIWGPYSILSTTGASYFLTILDDFSRASWVFLMQSKSETAPLIKQFSAMVNTQFHTRLQRVRSDNGAEFISLRGFFDEQGILFETSCVYTPQQNGRVERKHRHILNVARALRFQASLPIKFWGECVQTACYLINRTPSPLLQNRTPFELLYGRPPSLKHVKVFGCLCFASRLPRSSNKFEARSHKCVFLGYPSGKQAWRLYDLDTGRTFFSRDVVFYETLFPFTLPAPPSDTPSSRPNPAIYDDSPVISPTFGVTNDRGSIVTSPSAPQPEIQMTVPQPRRSNRSKQPSVLLRDYVCHTIQAADPPSLHTPSSPSSSSLRSGTPYPIAAYVSSNKFSSSHSNFLAAITAGDEPRSFNEAIQHEHWRSAMRSELDALEQNQTWIISTLPPDKKPIGCKWVYRIKYKSDGSIERYKARLVILGNRQVEGVDFTETFAPVAKMVTVRVFLSVAVIRDWEIHQMDVHNAFLHGDLDETVYMVPPPGYAHASSGQVCKLQKSLYGLRQAPCNWFSKLATALRTYGFHQSKADYSLFTLSRHGNSIHVLVYVDDLIIAGNNSLVIASFKNYLSRCFHMKDLGHLKYFLGLEIARNHSGIILSQRKYALEILAESGLLGSKPCDTPMDANHHLAMASGPDLPDPERYRRLIGRLVYLTITRPDLCFAVHTLSQFMKQPKEEHWLAALRVLRFIKGHPGQGLHLSRDSSLCITAFCDSDWAACPLTRRSVSGYFIVLGRSPISWKTKKQHTVSRSSAEAEYRSIAATCCEIVWLRSLLLCLGVDHKPPVKLLCDSQAALHISANPVFHERTKHIEIDCHYVRDLVLDGTVVTSHISTSQQPADIFTKALARPQFTYLSSKLGILDPHAPT